MPSGTAFQNWPALSGREWDHSASAGRCWRILWWQLTWEAQVDQQGPILPSLCWCQLSKSSFSPLSRLGARLVEWGQLLHPDILFYSSPFFWHKPLFQDLFDFFLLLDIEGLMKLQKSRHDVIPSDTGTPKPSPPSWLMETVHEDQGTGEGFTALPSLRQRGIWNDHRGKITKAKYFRGKIAKAKYFIPQLATQLLLLEVMIAVLLCIVLEERKII